MAITAEPACHMDITDVPISVRESDEADEDDQELCNTISQINARQSTELARLRVNYSRASSRHPPETPNHLAKPTTFLGRVKYGVQKFWRHQVSVVVAHEDCRDHLALERTFLGYLRTSLVLSMMGALVAQLFRLQRAPTPDPRFGFFVIGRPLACICHLGAITVCGIGAFKTWKTQNAMVRGKALSGGFEIIFVGVGVLLILITMFVLLTAIDIKKTHF